MYMPRSVVCPHHLVAFDGGGVRSREDPERTHEAEGRNLRSQYWRYLRPRIDSVCDPSTCSVPMYIFSFHSMLPEFIGLATFLPMPGGNITLGGHTYGRLLVLDRSRRRRFGAESVCCIQGQGFVHQYPTTRRSVYKRSQLSEKRLWSQYVYVFWEREWSSHPSVAQDIFLSEPRQYYIYGRIMDEVNPSNGLSVENPSCTGGADRIVR